MKLTAVFGLVPVGLLLAATSTTGMADEALDGAALYSDKGCVYCHGAAGREPALDEYPVLAGQNAAYLVQQTKDIRDRARDHGYTGMMQPAVAAWLEEQSR